MPRAQPALRACTVRSRSVPVAATVRRRAPRSVSVRRGLPIYRERRVENIKATRSVSKECMSRAVVARLLEVHPIVCSNLKYARPALLSLEGCCNALPVAGECAGENVGLQQAPRQVERGAVVFGDVENDRRACHESVDDQCPSGARLAEPPSASLHEAVSHREREARARSVRNRSLEPRPDQRLLDYDRVGNAIVVARAGGDGEQRDRQHQTIWAHVTCLLGYACSWWIRGSLPKLPEQLCLRLTCRARGGPLSAHDLGQRRFPRARVGDRSPVASGLNVSQTIRVLEAAVVIRRSSRRARRLDPNSRGT